MKSYITRRTRIHVWNKNMNKQTKQNTKQNNNTVDISLVLLTYRISSNNSQGRIFFFLHQTGAIIQGKAIIWEKRLFQILLTGSRVLNILFYYPVKSKSYHIK